MEKDLLARRKNKGKPFYYGLYQVLLILLLPFSLLFLLVRVILRPPYRSGMAQRFGLYPPGFFKPLQGKSVYWVHAVSVGEVISSGLLIRSLREKYPDVAIVFSTVTPTGQAAARRRLQGVDLFIYFPFDLAWVTRSIVRRISPELFIFFETEVWPNCLLSLSEKGIPAIMLNGRISARSFRRYRLVRFFLTHVLSSVSLFLMQTEEDVGRIIRMGAPPERVERTGNMKYDQAVSGRAGREAGDGSAKHEATRAELGLQEVGTLMIAGSTHEGEEEAVLEAYREIASSASRPVLLIATRHLERLPRVEELLTREGYRHIRKTKLCDSDMLLDEVKPEIILLDTLGELDRYYPVADLIFVGGSLVPVGGHNVLEVAACHKPVFFGPYMANFQEIADQLQRSGGGIVVRDGKALGEKMAWLMRHPEEYEKKGESAYLVVRNNLGAVSRNMDWISKWVDNIGPEKEA
ncbi:MAG: 3-deoxy-D-manno-octulosonic acid transferase [Nitrospiria bacterium]